MTSATFIVTGLFTTDGTGNAVAYTTGINGWGAITQWPARNDGLPDCLPADDCGPTTVICKL